MVLWKRKQNNNISNGDDESKNQRANNAMWYQYGWVLEDQDLASGIGSGSMSTRKVSPGKLCYVDDE